MAAWLCTVCSTVFSVGAPCCPHCKSTKHVEEGQEMPKITRHEGPSIAGASIVGGSWSSTDEPDAWPEPEAEGSEEPSVGSSSETSPETPPADSEPSETTRPRRARKTASRSTKAPTESSSAPSTDGGQAADTSAADES